MEFVVRESKEGKGVMVSVSRMASGGCTNSIFNWGVKNQDASSFLPILYLRPLLLDAPFPPIFLVSQTFRTEHFLVFCMNMSPSRPLGVFFFLVKKV